MIHGEVSRITGIFDVGGKKEQVERLFAVYLGGYAPNCNVELHDMVFVVGETIEATFSKLVEKWFIKSYKRFHYDGYMDLSFVDGHKITLSDKQSDSGLKLFYVHLGGYDHRELTELHKNCFLVDTDKLSAKDRARKSWNDADTPHKDVQFDIESCLQIDEVDKYHIHLQPTEKPQSSEFHLGYNLIPRKYIPSAAGEASVYF